VDIELATTFLEALGGSNFKQNGEWLKCSCPLSKFTHSTGHDANPSFGFTLQDGSRSYYNCYACRAGSAEELLQSLEMYWNQERTKSPSEYKNGIWLGGKQIDFKLARQCLENEEIKVKPLPAYSEFGQKQTKSFEEWPGYFLLDFPPVSVSTEATQYLLSRDVTPEEALTHDLRWDMKKRMVVMPYRNVYGKLAGARGRAIDDQVSGWKKHFDFTWNSVNNASLVWYNEPALQLPGPVVVVEGQFDALRVAKAYPKVVANMTARPMPSKMRRLLQSDKLIHIPDTDATGKNSVGLYKDYCTKNGLRYQLIELPPEVKDPGDTNHDYLFNLIQHHL
jgi:hypothetical protein